MKTLPLFATVLTLFSLSTSVFGAVRYDSCLEMWDRMYPGDTLWSPNGEWVFKIGESSNLAILDATNNWAQKWVFDPAEKIVQIDVNQQGLYLFQAVRNGISQFHQFPSRSEREDLFDKDISRVCLQNDGTLVTYGAYYRNEANWRSSNYYKHYWGSSSNYYINADRTIVVDMKIWKNFGKTEKQSCKPQLVVRDKNGATVDFVLKDRVTVKVKDGKKDVGFTHQLTSENYRRMHSAQVDCY